MAKAPCLVLVLACGLMGAVGNAQQPSMVQASAAASFVSSLGVNLHPNYRDTEWKRYSDWKKLVLDGGFGTVRLNWPAGDVDTQSIIKDLGSKGIKVIALVYQKTGPVSYYKALKADPGLIKAIWAVEGPNEMDLNGGITWARDVRSYVSELARTLRIDPATAKLRIIAPSIGRWRNTSAYRSLGDIGDYVDYCNVHAYTGGPSIKDADIEIVYKNCAIEAPGKPILNGETGISTSVPIDSSTPPGNWPVPEAQNAINLLRHYFEGFRVGWPATVLYELINESPSGSRWYNGLALVENWAKKPEFEAIQAVASLLKDPGSSFTPSPLWFGLLGAAANTKTLLLQKRDRSFWLAVWEQVDIWDAKHQLAINSPDVPLVLELAAPKSGAIYRPNAQGTNPVAVFNKVASLPFNSSAKVTIIEIGDD